MDNNNIRQIRQVMQPGGIANIMLEDKYQDDTGHVWSEAALVADVVNIMRLNTKQLAAVHDVEIQINRMTEERAAELIEGMAKNEDQTLVEAFEKIEDKQDMILREVMGADGYGEFLQTKQKAAYSVPNETIGQPEPEPVDQTEPQPDATMDRVADPESLDDTDKGNSPQQNGESVEASDAEGGED